MARRRLTPARIPAADLRGAPETKALLQPGDPRSTDPVPPPDGRAPMGGGRPAGAAPAGGPGRGRPPIAQVAGGAASEAALAALGAEMEAARREGRLIRDLPLGAVEEGHLERDRLPEAAEGEAMDALVASLREVGQRTPIEAVDLGDGRYGLISGWRRLTALRRLHAAGEGPDRVRALIRAPANPAEAYRAMVEENEIRADLSYWERARIVRRAAAAGAYPDEEAALAGLFGAASRPRRSKIRSFVAVVEALEGVLPFPAALSERGGLALARALRDAPDLPARLRAALAAAAPADPAAQAAVIEAVIEGVIGGASGDPGAAPPPRPAPDGSARNAPVPAPGPTSDRSAGGVVLRPGRRRLVIEGRGLDDPGLVDALARWFEDRAAGH